MDYKKHYSLLILKAKSRDKNEGYFENHHINPRSMGGDNSKDNLVKLTGREHFIAHILLHKMYPNHLGMAIAITRMRFDKKRVLNSKKYEWIKIKTSIIISNFHKKNAKEVQNRPEVKEKHRKNTKIRWKNEEYCKYMRLSNLGKNNPMYGKTVSSEVKNKTSASMGSKPFKVWKSICIRPSSPKLGKGECVKGEFVGEFLNKSEVEKLLIGVRRQSIIACLRNENPQTSGYIFEHV